MLEYARLVPGRGFRPVNSALYYGHRLMAHGQSRRRVGDLIASIIESRRPRIDRDLTCDLADLRLEGLHPIGRVFYKAQLDAIHDYLRDKDAVGYAGGSFRMDRSRAASGMFAYPLPTVLRCPHLLALANNPAVLSIASGYLGCTPTISSLGLRWSFPGNDAADVQHFHRDLDDWRFLKLFVYLTDVDAASGPHVFVRGTHLTSGGIFSRLYERGEVERIWGSRSVCTIVGQQGTSFIADTYGLHCGVVPTARPRLIFEVQYSLLPVFAFLYKPVRMDVPQPVDPYINRLILHRASIAQTASPRRWSHRLSPGLGSE
jgi:hypothetical protein